MLKDGVPRKYYGRSNNRDLFFIELCLNEELEIIHFNSSLPLTIFDDERSSILISEIIRTDVSDRLRANLIDALINHVITLPGIEDYYFTDFLLDGNGSYMDYYDSVTNKLLHEKDFDDYTVFSSEVNSFYFDFAKSIFEEELKKNTQVFLDKYSFEILIQNNEELSREYVNLFRENAQFVKGDFSFESGYEYFIMLIASEVKLFFVRRKC